MAKSNPVTEALTVLGLQTVGQTAYGCWKDYAFTVRHSAPYYYLDAAVRLNKKDKETAKALRDEMKKRFPKVVLGCVNEGDHVTFTFTLSRKISYAEQLRAIFDGAAEVLSAYGAAPADTCAVCGREHPDSLSLIGTYQPVHAVCVRTPAAETAPEKSAQERKKNYLTGILGAVIGVIIGLIPSLLSLQLFDRIYSVLYLLVPLLTMLGYRRFHGKLGSAALVIVSVLSLGGVVLLEFLAVTLSFKQELGMTLLPAMKYTISFLFDRVGVGVMIMESITELFFMAVGIFLSWLFLLPHPGHGKTAVKETARDTLRPIHAAEDDPDWLEK